MDGWAYKHEYPKSRKEDTQNSNKVNELEKTVEALSKKVLSLEKSTNNDEQSLINNKVKELEKVVGAFTRKVLFLESENTKLKTKEKESDSGVGKRPIIVQSRKEKELMIEEEMIKKDFGYHQSVSGDKEILVSSTPKKVDQNKSKKSYVKVNMFKCNMCNYECKRE